MRSLLRFDVSSIPTSATVVSATLRLYWSGNSNGNNITPAVGRSRDRAHGAPPKDSFTHDRNGNVASKAGV